MAEFGKGDPRWIVDERVDGRNVNAWHWVERDCTKWFKNLLTERLKDFPLCSEGNCVAKSIEKLDGEITYCNRKRKHMFFYEIELRIKWVATIDDKKYEGQIRAPSICDEEPISSMEMRVTLLTKSQQGDKLKKQIEKEAVPAIRDLITKTMDETKEHFKEPLPDEANGSGKKPTQAQSPGVLISKAVAAPSQSSCKDISMKLLFHSSPELMYQCLTEDQRLSFFTQSPAKLEKKNGGEFSLFGGQVTGKNINLVENKEITQEWRFQTWPQGHYSKVTIKLESTSGGTELTLTQTGVPISDFERTKSGWGQHFWERIQACFGFTFKKL